MCQMLHPMYNAFAYNKKLTSLDLSRWNTSKVKYMSGMFSDNESLTELNLGNLNTSNVVDMHNRRLLTETVNSTNSLFNNHWIPWQIIVDHRVTKLHIQALASYL